jgi:GT2 family glycosyltransferase
VSRPLVVAVVLNWCGEEDTAACIHSLVASDYQPLRVLLVDNASPDGSGERLRARFPEAEYLETEQNLGYAGGNNRGVARALELGAHYVLILNNDTVVDPGCVSRLVDAAASDARVGAVGPKILYFDEPRRVWFGGGEFRAARAAGIHLGEGEEDCEAGDPRPVPVSFLTGCCLLIPAPLAGGLGPFREDFFAYVEDVELCLRLRQAGHTLLYQPAARVWHRVAREGSAPPSAFQIFHRDRNRRRVVRSHFGPGARMRFAIQFFPSRVVLLAQYLLRGDRDRVRAVWRGMTAR